MASPPAATLKAADMGDAPGAKRASLARNLAWATGGPVVRIGSQVLCQMVLARLLAPADYGIFGVALVIVTFATFLSEAAGSIALIKNQHISTLDVRLNFTLQLTIGLVAALGLLAAAPLIAGFLRKPECVPVLQVMAINCLLTLSSVVSIRLLSRQMRFKEVQAINVGGYVLGYVVIAIPMAYLGYGVWALVAAWIAQTCTLLVVGYALVRHNIVPYLSARHVARQLGFGLQTFTSGILNWTIMTTDRLVVARFNSPTDLGIYTVAGNLASAPASQIVSSLAQVLFSNASKDQSDEIKLQISYRKSLLIVSTFAIPAFFTLASASTEVVNLLYGAKWTAAAPIVMPLALAMPFYAIYGVSTPIIWAKGRVGLDVAIQALTLACLFAGLLWVARMPPVMAAWVVLAAYVARALAAVLITNLLLDARIGIWRVAAHWTVVGAVTLGVQFEGIEAARQLGAPSPVTILLAGFIMIALLLVQFGLMARYASGLPKEFGRAGLAGIADRWRRIRAMWRP